MQDKSTKTSSHVFRVDQFVVPEGARSEFVARVVATHDVLKRQPGFVRDSLLEQNSGQGDFKLVTIVEWESQAHIDGARAAVTAEHRQAGFHPQETIERLGIKADFANYYKEIFA